MSIKLSTSCQKFTETANHVLRNFRKNGVNCITRPKRLGFNPVLLYVRRQRLNSL